MKLKSMGFIFMTILFLVIGCSANQKVESELILPEGLPNFVEDNDLKKVDWDQKAETFDGNIIGNAHKSGVIGADMPSVNIDQKWMWHLWGIENPEATKLTVVGLHKETGAVHQILTTNWTIDLTGENNGADAHAPSSVNVPMAGEWAILLYTNGSFFDELVYEIKE